MFLLRPASSSDAPTIRSLVRRAKINPIGLDWHRFIVAVDSQAGIIGCGQVKTHADGSRELASIAVSPDWRGQGVARAMIHQLIATYPGDLFLTCRGSLEPFYAKFGFQTIQENEMPAYFRRVYRLFKFIRRLGLSRDSVVVMKRG